MAVLWKLIPKLLRQRVSVLDSITSLSSESGFSPIVTLSADSIDATACFLLCKDYDTHSDIDRDARPVLRNFVVIYFYRNVSPCALIESRHGDVIWGRNPTSEFE